MDNVVLIFITLMASTVYLEALDKYVLDTI